MFLTELLGMNLILCTPYSIE